MDGGQNTIKLLAVEAKGPGADIVLHTTNAPEVPGRTAWQKYQVLIACGISTAVMLAVLLFSGILDFEGRTVRLEEKIEGVEEKIVLVDGRIGRIENDIERLRDNMDSVRNNVDSLDEKLNRILLQLANYEDSGNAGTLAD